MFPAPLIGAVCSLADHIAHDNSQEELQRAFDTMVHGPINLTRAALPRFRERGSGWLLYMNSQSGFVGEPGATAYCAPKFAIEGSRTLARRHAPLLLFPFAHIIS